MTRRSLVFVSLLAFTLPLFAHGNIPTPDNVYRYFAELRGENEVPPRASSAVGAAFVTIDANNNVTFDVNIGGLQNPTLSHIHEQVAGQNGNVVVNFALSPSAFSNGGVKGSIQGDSAVTGRIRTNPAGFYVNVHSTQFGGGEIRGQMTPASEFDVPIAGNVTTGAGDHFVTDLRIFNPSATNKAVVLIEFLPAGSAANATPVASKAVEIAPRGEAVLDDVAGPNGLNVPGQLGAIRVVSNIDLAVTSNIYNDQRSSNHGTFGQFVPASDRLSSLPRGVVLHLSNKTRDVSNPSGFRTNIGFFNPNQADVTVNLQLRDAAGALLGSKQVTLAMWSQQQNAITAYFPTVDLSNAPALTLSFDSTLPIFVYGAVNDNVSGDSIFVPAQNDTAGTP